VPMIRSDEAPSNRLGVTTMSQLRPNLRASSCEWT
jgi:hypothetical protein